MQQLSNSRGNFPDSSDFKRGIPPSPSCMFASFINVQRDSCNVTDSKFERGLRLPVTSSFFFYLLSKYISHFGTTISYETKFKFYCNPWLIFLKCLIKNQLKTYNAEFDTWVGDNGLTSNRKLLSSRNPLFSQFIKNRNFSKRRNAIYRVRSKSSTYRLNYVVAYLYGCIIAAINTLIYP